MPNFVKISYQMKKFSIQRLDFDSSVCMAVFHVPRVSFTRSNLINYLGGHLRVLTVSIKLYDFIKKHHVDSIKISLKKFFSYIYRIFLINRVKNAQSWNNFSLIAIYI